MKTAPCWRDVSHVCNAEVANLALTKEVSAVADTEDQKPGRGYSGLFMLSAATGEGETRL